MAKKESLSKIILDDLKKRILSGEYSSGDKLPPERELAEFYKVSRIPVREALSELEKEDIVTIRRGSGAYITNMAHSIRASEDHILESQDDIFMQETIQIRRLIEAEGSRQAALHATQDDIILIQKSLFHSIDEIRKFKAGKDNRFFQADLEFHQAVALASHSSFYADCLNTMPHIISTHQYWSLKNTTPMDEVVSYHTAIFEAILAENSDRAYEAMYQHLSRVEALIINPHNQQ